MMDETRSIEPGRWGSGRHNTVCVEQVNCPCKRPCEFIRAGGVDLVCLVKMWKKKKGSERDGEFPRVKMAQDGQEEAQSRLWQT